MAYSDLNIFCGDSLKVLRTIPDGTVQTCITSPPYWGLRDYSVPTSIFNEDQNCDHSWENDTCEKCGAWRGCLGLEPEPSMYVDHVVEILREVKRALRNDGTLWLNLGDSYYNYRPGAGAMVKQTVAKTDQNLPVEFCPRRATKIEGLKEKDLVGIPWRVALALQEDGWYLRMDIIWSKLNPMPESVRDRPTKSHEYIFLLSKSQKYYYDQDAIREQHQCLDPEYENYRPNKLRHYQEGTRDHYEGKYADVNNTPGDSYHPLGRNKRSVWNIATKPFPEAHFAVFPVELIEPCVLAGSSDQACPKCGAPWIRVIENIKGFDENDKCNGCGQPRNKHVQGPGSALRGQDWNFHGDSSAMLDDGAIPCNAIITKGWEPSCECEGNDGSVASTVLDPFMGSGTTGLASVSHRRWFIGIDVSEKYCEMAKKRLGEIQMGLF